MSSKNHPKKLDAKRKTILELSDKKAREFFLKPESYCRLEMPPYISFGHILTDVGEVLREKQEKQSFDIKKAGNYDDVNYVILSNKDGRHAWRPLQLIHPVLYVELVYQITRKSHWEMIKKRFREFQIGQINCLSYPVVSLEDESDKAQQVSHWWEKVEQRSIELSLEYEYLLETDITDCYGSIYTHSIPWALHGKPKAKQSRQDKKLLGNIIDMHIRSMCHGQTNGIPQGTVLMDFVAEIVLGYIDLELSEKIKAINDFHILRYRDDYRIFVNNPQTGEKIVKLLTETLIDLGLKLNPSKTKANSNVVRASIKSDKLSWAAQKRFERSPQKQLLIIHDHSRQFPNSGSLIVALTRYRKQIERIYNHNSFTEKPSLKPPLPLISIIADIAYRNPRVFPICCAILSQLLESIEDSDRKKDVIKKIKNKLLRIPNTGHMEIWLQRVTFPFCKELEYEEPICKLVSGEDSKIWNNDWIECDKLKNAIKGSKIVDKDALQKTPSVISSKEVELFLMPYPP